MPNLYIISGGTTFNIRPHLALSAPAYGQTGREILNYCVTHFEEENDQPVRWMNRLYLTKMAGGRYLDRDNKTKYFDTNEDISKLVDEILADPEAKVLFMPVALCDFDVDSIESFRVDADECVTHTLQGTGKDLPRLKTDEYKPHIGPEGDYGAGSSSPTLRLALVPSEKIISKIRRVRKDIFLVGFKTTTGASEQEQFEAGLKLLKQSSCNLVLANDLHTRLNMVITPEQAKYHVTTNRIVALSGLVKIAAARCCGDFTRSTVVPGDLVPWGSPEVPYSLRTVVDYCIKRGAYRPFLGATVGHFAVKVDNTHFLTSVRKTNFNDLQTAGLVKVEADGNEKVIAYGARPSVGGQSQRVIFANHPEVDAIVHFHCQLKPGSEVPIRPQWQNECGSQACGKNTSDGLASFGPIKAVFLEKHGPNIVFNKDVDPQLVISFIEHNFDLEHQTSELS